MASAIPRPSLPEGPFLVVGLARSGVAAAAALAARGERVYGTDRGSPAAASRLADAGVELDLDGDGTHLLDRVSAVIKSPGVPPEAPVIAAARAGGMPVLGELELGWRLAPNRFVAVTGTNGKTTVTEWLGHAFRTAGMPVAVAGNVGTPLSAVAAGLDPDATVVCECSSFQLEDSVAFAPEVAVFLNISPDHADRHPTLAAYLGAKLRIFAAQPADSDAVIDADEPALRDVEIPGDARCRRYGIEGCVAGACTVRYEAGAIHDDAGPLVERSELALAGEHNIRNAMAVATAALSAGVPRDAVAAALRDFTAIPHRLEPVGELGGVAYVNDSKATNVAAAQAALVTFGDGVHAIFGGSLKGERFAPLVPAVAGHCVACYLIGEAAEQLAADLAPAGVPLRRSGDLETAVAEAATAARPGETVLLAPACASFDAFADYEDRGRRFRELVEGLR
ncbi:MAG TPA: UDP-N-acetylmuramoyl-L-alanine--D-glutamate ligase [Solirubrobacterales bacterium]|nr:UDP-N-acetylmuramoyl-L-alanine--D-glutamate ligase [Solirubrobacterales bacterium]